MNRQRTVFRLWQDLGITTKFTTAFGLLLILMALIATLSVVALILVRRETENAIVTSTGIQRLVLEMDAGLQEARRLEKDFFWRYPTIGYSAAFQTYAEPAQEQIAQVRALSAELQHIVSEADVSDAWRQSDANLNLYLSAAGRHAATVEEAAALIARLASDEDAFASKAAAETGLQAQLAGYSSLLEKTLQLAGDSGLMILYYEMQSLEKDYLLARRRPFMQSAFNAAIPLREAIEAVTTLDADQKTRVLGHLDNYLAVAAETLELDAAIASKFSEFDLQAEAVDHISAELIALADQEVARARVQINRTNRLVTRMVVVAASVGLASAFGIAQVLNNGITHNVVKLTQFASELQAGNLQARARIESTDELGQLADSFNDMATRISDLVGSLERKVAARTEALRQERDFAESLIDTAQAIVLVLDTEGRIVRFNPFMEALSGYRLEEVRGKDWFSTFLSAQDHTRIRELFERAVGDIQARGNENPIVTKDGQERTIRWNDKTLKDGDGNVVGLLTIGQDITERVRAEEALKAYSARLEVMVDARTRELQEAQEQLVRREKLAVLGQLAGGVAHELRNPLGAIKNAAYFLNMVLAERQPDSHVQETLEILEKEVGTSERIISDLLDFARAKQPTRRKADLNQVVQAALSRTEIPESVETVAQLDKELPPILADPHQLDQVFGNLIRNGVQAMPDGGRLVVQAGMEDPEWLTVSITDTGVGISEENREKIFEPLFTTKAKGIGLGLALAKTLVEGHGGTIEVQSAVGKGSTFTVRLPLAKEQGEYATPNTQYVARPQGVDECGEQQA